MHDAEVISTKAKLTEYDKGSDNLTYKSLPTAVSGFSPGDTGAGCYLAEFG